MKQEKKATQANEEEILETEATETVEEESVETAPETVEKVQRVAAKLNEYQLRGTRLRCSRISALSVCREWSPRNRLIGLV